MNSTKKQTSSFQKHQDNYKTPLTGLNTVKLNKIRSVLKIKMVQNIVTYSEEWKNQMKQARNKSLKVVKREVREIKVGLINHIKS